MNKRKGEEVMKKILLLCLFLILSLGAFAQKIKSDGKPHFDKILWELWDVEQDKAYSRRNLIFQVVKIDNDYYLTDSYYPKEWKKKIKTADRSNYQKLKIYKNLYLMDNNGNIYGYDLAKKKPVLIDKDLNILEYFKIYEQ